jgi:hypothetical protein
MTFSRTQCDQRGEHDDVGRQPIDLRAISSDGDAMGGQADQFANVPALLAFGEREHPHHVELVRPLQQHTEHEPTEPTRPPDHDANRFSHA